MPDNSVFTAQVVLFDAAYGYDKEYTYRYPEILRGVLRPGMRVLVPFGRSNVKRLGFCLSLNEIKNPDYDIKYILSVVDKEPLLNDELMGLVHWLREHTFCTFGEAYKTVVPSGFGLVRKLRYSLSNHRPDEELSSEETLLYEKLSGAGSVSEFDKIIESLDPESETKVLRSLIEKGVVEESDEFKRRVGDETVRMVRISDTSAEDAPQGMTKKQKAVFDFLSENGAASVKEVLYYLSTTQTIISNMVKKGILEEYRYEALRVPELKPSDAASDIVLSPEQKAAFDGILSLVKKGKAAGALLHGVTGSGKTAVFMSLIKSVLEMGKTAVMLVPEISLTPQTVERFSAVFGNDIALIHSSLSMGRRSDEFKRIKRGEAKIVIGTRSAIFAPLENIGIIIMDEEGESSYKSDSSPRYHARDVAIKRCGDNNCVLLMASATPSLETYYFAKSGRYSLFELKNRYSNTKLPQVVVADMITEAEEGNDGVLCRDMVRRIKEETEKGNQSILLLNRRGFNTHAACMHCHTAIKCPQCLIPLTYHKSNGKLMCHYCGYYCDYDGRCPDCGSDSVRLSGQGTQYIETRLSEYFPNARILRMDADTTYSRYAYEEKFSAFARGEYDIMIGTQMIAKGLDFPNVTTVGVVSLDNSLFAGDYRSFERTFSLLTQVCGRGGRADKEAVAYIQTYIPDHHIIELSSRQDYPAFYEGEIALRKEMIYPPFCDICSVYFSAVNESDALTAAYRFIDMMKHDLSGINDKFPLRVLGPAKSGYGRIGGRHKYVLTVKCRVSAKFRQFMSGLLRKASSGKEFSNVRVYADINGQ